MDINTLIQGFYFTFPQFFLWKRYKLINFAPNYGIVDKTSIVFILKQKQQTVGVNNRVFRGENEMSK